MDTSLIQEKEASSEDFKEIKIQMSYRATDIIAGALIADKNFPQQNTLPRFIPLPFNNFGHFYLFDHARFLTIIYDTLLGFKKIGKEYKDPVWPLFLSIGIPILLMSIVLSFSPDPEYIFYCLIIAVGFGFGLYLSLKPNEKKFNEKIAEYKANVIADLHNGEWEENSELQIPEHLEYFFSLIGQASCDEELCPVIIAFDDRHPFPGYGKLLLDNQFVCAPKNIEITRQKKDADLFFAVTAKLEESLSESDISNIGFGKVIVLNSGSISIDSIWLDENKIPYLNKQTSEVESLYDTDSSASKRIYFVVEVLFPKYDSAACFFVRSYKAGNSAGFHIAITTIGPPEKGEQYLKDRIMRHNMEVNEADTVFKKEVISVTSNSTISIDTELSKILSLNKFTEKFQVPIERDNLEKIDPLEEDKDDEKITQRISEIVNNDTTWPGQYYFYQNNIRERKSLKLGGDFFGYPELIGSITSAYSQIVDRMLSIMESQGFDVSNYKDKEGKLTINAEKIEQVIVGELVNLKSNEEDKNAGKKSDIKITQTNNTNK